MSRRVPATTRQAHQPGTAGTGRRQSAVLLPLPDRIALIAGILLAALAVSFFVWKMVDRISTDRALGPVSASTPTPPPPPAPRLKAAARKPG